MLSLLSEEGGKTLSGTIHIAEAIEEPRMGASIETRSKQGIQSWQR